MNPVLKKLYTGLQNEIPEAIPENEITLEKIQDQFNKYGGANTEAKNDFTKVSTITSLGMFKTELEKAINKCKEELEKKDKLIASGIDNKTALADKEDQIKSKEEENNKLKQEKENCQTELEKQKQEIEAVRNECNLKLEITKSVMQKLCDDASTSNVATKDAEIKQLEERLAAECELKLAIQKETMNQLYEQNLKAFEENFKKQHDTELDSNKQNLENECNLKIEIMKATMQQLCDNKVTELNQTINKQNSDLESLKKQLEEKKTELDLLQSTTSSDKTSLANKHTIELLNAKQECELKIEITKATMKSLYEQQIEELNEKITTIENNSKTTTTELEERLKNECQLKIDIIKATTEKLCQERIESSRKEIETKLIINAEADKLSNNAIINSLKNKEMEEALTKAKDECEAKIQEAQKEIENSKLLAKQECTLKIEIIKATMRQLYEKQIEELTNSNDTNTNDKQQLQEKIKKLEEELLKNRVTDAVKDNMPKPSEPIPQPVSQLVPQQKPVNPQIVLIPDNSNSKE